MRVSSVRSTYCFVATRTGMAQVVQVAVAAAPADLDASVRVTGRAVEAGAWSGRLDAALAGRSNGPAWAPAADAGLATQGKFTPSVPLPDGVVVDVPVLVAAGHPVGTSLPIEVTVEAGEAHARAAGELVVREPGWRMLMVPHFHYDPVWWNTQAAYTSAWDELVWAQERRETFQHTGLALVEAHLERARVDPLYKFVLAEVDYLKPFWDLYPDRRHELRALIAAGRLEVVGGTYNEPNTNLTSAETAIRTVVYGLGFQRDVMGADPRSAWQLDVFGHDPQFPGIMADCGIGSSAWARGPFHQWGPRREAGSNSWMQFPSEFEWVAPNGRGLLTSYMPNHYSAGWELELATTLEGAMWRAYELFCDLAEVAATRVTMLPVGTDYTPPGRFVTAVCRAWSDRYAWPRFEVGLPREFFAAVRTELAERGGAPSPQSRDMNPIYTGKDVSFIDTKQGQRLAERHLAEAEALAALGSVLGAPVPHRALDKAWRQLVFGAHHDGITGSESDQVYLDLLGGWREAYELACAVEQASRAVLLSALDTTGPGAAVVVTNMVGQDRSDMVHLDLPVPPAGDAFELTGPDGSALPTVLGPSAELGADRARLSFLASQVPGVGYATYRLHQRRATELAAGGRDSAQARAGAQWVPAAGLEISNEFLAVTADPGRGGGLAQVTDRGTGFDLVPQGEVANELLVYPEYPAHPRFGEGPWNLLPSGPPTRSSMGSARVHKERSPVGERFSVEGLLHLGGPASGPDHGRSFPSFRYRQVATLWYGVPRLELRTELHDWAAQDHLVRLRVPTTLVGASAVSAVGDAVVARSFALIDVDAADAPWTLDNPAAEWFGLSTALVVEAAEAAAAPAYHERAIGVAEVVVPPGEGGAPWARELVVALLQKGVTATCSEAQRNRYGALLGDSNLPDFRVAVGSAETNPFVAAVLQAAGPRYAAELERQLAEEGVACLLVPPEMPLAQVWRPNADLRGPRQLPVLVVAGSDSGSGGAAPYARAVAQLTGAIRTGRVRVVQPAALVPSPEKVPSFSAAIVNRGTPGFAVDSAGAMYVSLLRACTGWPSGVWIDPPRRTAPDGSAFELEHWSHVFEHALVLRPGDWRQGHFVEEAQSFNRPLVGSLEAPHPGALPARARLFGLQSQPASVVLGALKPAGHPLASGDLPEAADRRDKGDGHVPVGADWPVAGSAVLASGAGDGGEARGGAEITLRCYESCGSPARAEIVSWWPLRQGRRANLVEEPAEELALASPGDDGGRFVLELAAGELATLRIGLSSAVPAAGAAAAAATTTAGATPVYTAEPAPGAGPGPRPAPRPAPQAEPAQPVFSRYWLHNKGAAPVGNQAVSVHMLVTSLALRAGDRVQVTAQVASGAARGTRTGTLELIGPSGWEIAPRSRPFSLAPGAFVHVPVTITAPIDARPGRRFLAARIADDQGQAQEDIVTIDLVPHLLGVEGDGLGLGARGPGTAVSVSEELVAPGPTEREYRAGALGALALPRPFGHPSGQMAAELEASINTLSLDLGAGERGVIVLRLANRAADELR
ncbi:MAG TPA: NEW3 domain-containing protein, partial [Acidimicrobiales bacterium]|nr:NEW3 domain-containing protein [Acidimicrobiales bacterium]